MKFRKTAALLAAMSLLIGGIPVGFGSPAQVEAAAGDTNIALGTTIEVSGSENAASWPESRRFLRSPKAQQTSCCQRWRTATLLP